MKAYAVWELDSESNDFVVMNDILVVQADTLEHAAETWAQKRIERASHHGFCPANFNIIVLDEVGERHFVECDIKGSSARVDSKIVNRHARHNFSNSERSSRSGINC